MIKINTTHKCTLVQFINNFPIILVMIEYYKYYSLVLVLRISISSKISKGQVSQSDLKWKKIILLVTKTIIYT